VVEVHRIETGRWRENCYVLVANNGEAVVIDPGADAAEIHSLIETTGVSVKAVLLTHGHFDHIGAVAELRRLYEIPCFLHPDDRPLVRRANLYRALFDADEPIEIPVVDSLDSERRHVVVGSLRAEVLLTPGHTPGSVCFRIGDELFSGDTFHRGVVGRTDLPGGSPAMLARSLETLRRLPPEVRVHPGHGDATTIGAEVERGALASCLEEV
jgi:glyoxylase-like metal-dependent hydrolase (beta-lactamase superfamily II)